MNENDRRVKKTKKALQAALAKLLGEKELHRITVKELAEEADMHRATFYVHYQDIYDLHKQLEDAIFDDLTELMTGTPACGEEGKPIYENRYGPIVDYAYDNVELANIFLGKAGSSNFYNRMCTMIEEQYLQLWLAEDGINEVTAEMRYMTTYQVKGCLAIISRWIDNGFDISKKEVIDLLTKTDTGLEYIL